MSRRVATLFAACGLAAAAAAAAAAHAGQAEDFESQIQRIEARMIPGGWTPLAPPARIDIGSGASGEYSWAFSAGQNVSAAGACGDACAEVRLNLLDPAGVLLARSYAVADGWALEAEIQETGQHLLVIAPRDCRADPCRVGLLTYMRWPD